MLRHACLTGSNVTFQIQNRYNIYGFSGQKVRCKYRWPPKC